jgi:hypothetical protein
MAMEAVEDRAVDYARAALEPRGELVRARHRPAWPRAVKSLSADLNLNVLF